MRSFILPICLALAACGDPAKIADQSVPDNKAVAESAATGPEGRPVRIGELGPAFQACNAAGTTRSLRAGEALPIRSAPFDNAPETGTVASGTRFFICSRSHDQKWFGIVADPDGRLADKCGVSEPVTRRRDYEGPCRSGWVQSAFVKVVAGDRSEAGAVGGMDKVSAPASSALPRV